MDNLVKSMNQDHNPGLAEGAAEAIAYLTRSEDPTTQSQLACFPNLLESLGALVSKGQNPVVQKHVAYALSCFALGGQSIKSRIFNLPGLLQNFVKFIHQDQNPDLAMAAASAVAGLSSAKDRAIQRKMAHFPNLLEGLGACLGASLLKSDDLVLQTTASSAAAALLQLGLNSDSIKARIFNIPGLMGNLVELMGQDQNSSLADLSAHNIGVLASIKNTTIQGQIARFPNLLECVRASLSKGGNPSLQKNAGLILSNLVQGDRSTREKILKFPGLTDGMLKLAQQELEQQQEQDENDYPELAEHLARIMAHRRGSAIKRESSRSPNRQGGAEASSSTGQTSAMEDSAARVLAQLGFGKEVLK